MNNTIKYLEKEFFDKVGDKKKYQLTIIDKLLAVFGGLYLFLYLQRPFKAYKIIHVTSNEQLTKIFSFRYKIYCITDKLLKASNYPNKLETDQYDEHSAQFAVLSNDNQVIGTFRLIKYSDQGFPTEEEFKLDPLNDAVARKTVEISRLMIKKDYRKTMLLLDILKAIYQYSRSEKVEYWYGCAEPWFIRTLNKIVGPLKILDKPQHCFNAINYPFHVKVDDLENNVKRKSRIVLMYFKHRSKNIKI